MQIFVRNTAGNSTTLEVTGDVHLQVASTFGLTAGAFHLTSNGKVVASADELEKDQTVDVSVDLLGAGKKRKKKNYTKPKRIPHKHKKVKLAVLKFYKVDGNDKVQRLRKDCPNCGRGVFMAMHTVNGNRYYCGKCTLTYVFKDGEKADA